MADRKEPLSRAQATMRRLQHEVRTPIAEIVGYSELLEEELEDRGQEDLAPDLQKIRIAAQRLLDLVDGRLRGDAGAGAPPLPEEAESESTVAPSAASESDTASGETANRILVVDSDANQRDLLARRLEKQGFAVDTARDGIEGLRRVESRSYDVVLLEVLMPRMNGLEVVERMRRDRSRSELPIILVTALDGVEDTVEGLERGANDYVTKPFDFPVLASRIRTQLELHHTARQVARLARQLEFRSAFIQQALGRDVSEESLVEASERPGAFDLGGERRPVVAVAADVRGTRRRLAELAADRHVAVLSSVLGGLGDVVERYRGTLDAVNGDALTAIFGLPLAREDDAERAVACAVAFQLELDEINDRNRRLGLPAVELGVGVASGDVVVVGFGTGDRLRYKAVGEPLARAVEIEGAAGGTEVWICEATRERLGGAVRVDREREIRFADPEPPQRVYRVLGVGGSQLISLRRAPPT